MAENKPTEQQVEMAEPVKEEAASQRANSKGPTQPPLMQKQSAFKRFMSGPQFTIIPSQYETTSSHRAVAAGQQEAAKRSADVEGGDKKPAIAPVNYLETLKKLVVRKVDVDGIYGLTEDELVPLPFDVPKWSAYIIDVFLGIYLVAQAVVVMFLAITVENRDRSWKSGKSYDSDWRPVVEALIFIYPLITLLALINLTVEFCLRKFMYYRLLSMRILVDWENRALYQNFFFYYFMIAWALMNVWAIYGLVAYYNKNGNNGVDPVSLSCFIIVNLQTVQLLIYYNRVCSSEKNLVSLNQIFERAPIEAQHLLTYTYVIEERDLREECFSFAVDVNHDFWRRVTNLLTCGLACRSWRDKSRRTGFDIERLKHCAPNYETVEKEVLELKHEMGIVGVDAYAASPDDVRINTDGNDEATDAPKVDEMGRPLGTPPAGKPRSAAALTICGWSPLHTLYRKMYASMHSMHVSLMVHVPSWPFRLDVPYFRLLTLIQVLGWFACGGIVVLGWYVSTRQTNCYKSNQACTTCQSIHARYFDSQEPTCMDLEYTITKLVNDTVGNYTSSCNNQQLRYANFQCTGNFTTPYPPQPETCPAT